MTSTILVFLTRFFAAPGVRWVGCNPKLEQCIFFANHTSNLDTLILWSALPKCIRAVTRPVAAQDYWLATALRRHLAITIFKSVLIERKKVTQGNNPLDLLLKATDEGASLIIFPEGGRSGVADPGPFKSGLYHFAKKRPNVQLIPVFIDNANRILPKGEFLPVPLLSSITFGAPIKIGDGETKIDFLERARKAMIHLKKNEV